jgi:transcriptional regulatory protein RtcR
LPGLARRPEDIEPNLSYELDRYAERHNSRVTFNKEAWERFLTFGVSPRALWTGNFRDLNGAVTRMATLARGGRITKDNVEEEIARLKVTWRGFADDGEEDNVIVNEVLDPETAGQLDLFDRAQLAIVLKVCRTCKTLSEAGRRLFSVSRIRRSRPNDADRLRKYLAKFGIQWTDIHL